MDGLVIKWDTSAKDRWINTKSSSTKLYWFVPTSNIRFIYSRTLDYHLKCNSSSWIVCYYLETHHPLIIEIHTLNFWFFYPYRRSNGRQGIVCRSINTESNSFTQKQNDFYFPLLIMFVSLFYSLQFNSNLIPSPCLQKVVMVDPVMPLQMRSSTTHHPSYTKWQTEVVPQQINTQLVQELLQNTFLKARTSHQTPDSHWTSTGVSHLTGNNIIIEAN